MHLRISNLSKSSDIKIEATNSAQLFDGIHLPTSTDSTLSLIPQYCELNGPQIEGTVRIVDKGSEMRMTTDSALNQVIISRSCGASIQVPMTCNVAIEWDKGIRAIRTY